MYLIFLIIILSEIIIAQEERTEHWYVRNHQFSQEFSSIPAGKVIFLGNSITEGFDLKNSFPESEPVNRGIIADHIDGALERLDTSVVLLQPSRLYIMIGINDIGRGDSDSLIISRYEIMLKRIKQGSKVTITYLTSILPTSPHWTNCPREKIVRINHMLSGLAEKYKCEWMNIYPLFVNANGYLKTDLSVDGLHLNQSGYNIWKNVLHKSGLN